MSIISKELSSLSAQLFTDLVELISHSSKRRDPLLLFSSAFSVIHFMAAFAFSSDRQSITTEAPRLYMSLAVSLPIPVLAPVMTTTLPSSLAVFLVPFMGGIFIASIMVPNQDNTIIVKVYVYQKEPSSHT